ncbi:hypothetical protein SAMN04488144_103285 [Methylobacterium sp. 190mf]|nr:hypothetical protein SAMN04488144_103285 [Methylobacterium sp. 190mf]
MSIDRAVRIRSNREEIEIAAEIVGQIERARFPIQTISRASSLRRRFTPDDVIEIVRKMDVSGKQLMLLINDPLFRKLLNRVQARLVTSARGELKPEVLMQYPEFGTDEISLHQVLTRLAEFIEAVKSETQFGELFGDILPEIDTSRGDSDVSRINLSALRRIVPEQKIAPVQFKIEDDKIFIDPRPSKSDKKDKTNIEISKEKILDDGREIISKLKTSNCDKRLIENFEALQQSIASDENAIRIGVNNISFGFISAVFKDELPEAINASLQAHNLSVNMYVSQFPDWVRFSENAMAAELTEEDALSVKTGVGKIINYLDNNPEIADPSVSRALKGLSRTIDNPAQSSKKATFAVIRTAENLLSKVFHYAISYFEKLSVDTAKEVHKTAVKGLAITIVTLGVSGAAELSGVSARIKELSWLKNAIEIIEKQLKPPTPR